MIDVHCHLNFEKFTEDVEDVIKRANNTGVEIIINTGTKLDSSQKAVELAETHENMYAIIGIHPHHADKHDLESDWLEQLEKLGRSSKKIIGIGEVGMDYFSYESNGIVDPKLQQEIFETQIELAHKLNIPLQIHNRHAGHDVINVLKAHKHLLKQNNPGMFHCFAGDKEFLKDALDLGFCIGFDGNITYPGLAPKETVTLTELATLTPLDRMVTETDSPYLAPVPLRGSRNEPKNVILVGEFLAKIKGVSFEEINQITTQNTKRLFGI